MTTDTTRLLVRLEASTTQLQKEMAKGARAASGAATTIDKRWNKSSRNMRREMDRSASTFKRYQFGIQNAAFQVGDFAVQVAGGQSAVRAFSQQAPQFLGAFGAIGAVIGAGTAILAPFIGNLLLAEDELKNIDSLSLDGVRGRLAELKKLQEEYNTVVAVSGTVRTAATEASLSAIQREYAAKAALLALERVALDQRRFQLNEELQASKDRIEALKAEQSIFTDQATLEKDGGANAPSRRSQEQLIATQELVDANEDLFLTIRRQNAELDLVNLSIETIDDAMISTGDSSLQFADNLTLAERMAQAIAEADIKGGIASATDEASALANELARAVEIFSQLAAPGGPDQAVDAVRGKFGAKPVGRTVGTVRGVVATRKVGPGRRRSGGKRSGGGRGGRSETDLFSSIKKEQQELERQVLIYGKSERAVAELTARYKLLDEAKRRNLDLDAKNAETGRTLREEIDAQAASIGRLTEKASAYREQADFMDDLTTQLEDGFIDAIIAGEDFGSVLENVARQLAKAALQAALFGKGPFGGGSGGGLLGGLFGGLFKGIPGFAGGTRSAPGGFAVVGERGPELVNLPRGSQVIPNHQITTAGSQAVDVRVSVDNDGQLQAFVDRRSTVNAGQLDQASLRAQRRSFSQQAREFDRRGVS